MKFSGKPTLLEFISADSLKQKSSLRAAVSVIYSGLKGDSLYNWFFTN